MLLEKLVLRNRRVLVRLDLNVPFNKQGQISDDTRLRACLPTLRYLLDAGAALILCSHLGRPLKKPLADGQIDVLKFSLKPLQQALSSALGTSVLFSEEPIGPKVQVLAEQLVAGQVLLLENTRFNAGEEAGDLDLAQAYAALAEVYVNDAFGAAHRAHATTALVAQYFSPENKAFGLLMRSELENAQKLIHQAEKPVLALVGGAKVSDKIQLLDKLLETVQVLIIGGAMANTFILAQGGTLGRSLVERENLDLALRLLAKAKTLGVEVLLPTDARCALGFENVLPQIRPSAEIPDDEMALDIGPASEARFMAALAGAKTIFWNGPMGVFEFSHYAQGTLAMAQALAEATRLGAYTLVGGGDSVAALNQLNMAQAVSYVSTGGGAMLELLEGKTLPGVAAIQA